MFFSRAPAEDAEYAVVSKPNKSKKVRSFRIVSRLFFLWKNYRIKMIFYMDYDVHQIQILSEIMTQFCHCLSSRKKKKGWRTMRTSTQQMHPNLHLHLTLTQTPVRMMWRSATLRWILNQSLDTRNQGKAPAVEMRLNTLMWKSDFHPTRVSLPLYASGAIQHSIVFFHSSVIILAFIYVQ